MDNEKDFMTWDSVIKSLVNPEDVTIKIKYFTDLYPDLKKIEKIKVGDWIDLYTAERTLLYQGQSTLIPLGVAMKLPVGYEAIIAPRSGTYKKYGIIQTNSIGVIDETYCGDDDMWRLPVYATKITVVPANTRICQFRIIRHQPNITFEEVQHMESENRGGFGSTGI